MLTICDRCYVTVIASSGLQDVVNNNLHACSLLVPHVIQIYEKKKKKVTVLCSPAAGNERKIELKLISMGVYAIAKLCQIYFTNDISF